MKQLPEVIGKLQNLITLDISYNKPLQKLPKSLGYLQLITSLNIDGLKLSYPPEDILSGGTIVIIAFLANESGIEYSPEDSVLDNDLSRETSSENVQAIYYDKNSDVQVLHVNSLPFGVVMHVIMFLFLFLGNIAAVRKSKGMHSYFYVSKYFVSVSSLFIVYYNLT